MRWRKRQGSPLAPDHAKRQGDITRLAFLMLGRETAITFLNTAHAGLGGRPLDLATASDQGRNSVEREIGRLAYAAPRDAPMPKQPLEADGRELPGDRRERSREPAEAHFRHLRGPHNAHDARPDGGARDK